MIVNRRGVLFVLAATVAFGGVAQAQQDQDPEALIEQAKRLRSAGDDQAAYELYVRAYGLGRTARAAGQLALCEAELNRWVDSEIHLTEALRAGDDPWVRKNRAVLSDWLSKVKMKLGRVEVTGRPDGAEVEVAGRSVGKLPLPGPLRVPAAPEVFVRVAAPGFRTLRRTVEVLPGELARVVIDLEPGTGEPTTPPLAQPGQAGAAGGGGSVSDVGYGPAPRAGNTQRKVAWVGLGTAAAFGAAGGVGLLVRFFKTREFNDYMNKANGTRCNTAVVGNGGGPCSDLLDTADTGKTVGIVGLAAAGVVGLVSAILMATAPPSMDLALSAGSIVGPGPAGAQSGASIGWRF